MSTPSPEQRQASTVSTLVAWCAVLSAALTVAIIFAIIGFTRSGTATNSVRRIARQQAATAHQVALSASNTASAATTISLTALHQLQAEAAGECYRVNYLRWQVDHAEYASWIRDYTAAQFLRRFPSAQLRPVAHAFHEAARAAYFLPLTDCPAADQSPTTYRAPNAMPFNRVPARLLARVLRNPPQPPAR